MSEGSIGHDQHPDLVADVGQRLGQGLAVLATLGEAAARLAAEEMRRAERREEQAAQQRAEADSQAAGDGLARHAAARRAAQLDRRLIAHAVDPDWLARADLLDLARVWRAARLREHQFPEARAAAETVEDRLRNVYPRPMDLYDQAVAGGASPAAAMRVAAAEMALTRPARPHGGRRSPAVEAASEPPLGGERFDAAVRQERARLADGVPPATYAEELERLGVGGHAAAQALREVLAARAGQELRQGSGDAATPDNPATAGFDEHATTGLPRNARHVGDANRTAAQLAAEWYPDGLHQPAPCPPTWLTGRRPTPRPRLRSASERR
ncbi:MAG TPA: hypothetical protein VFR67_09600 [Pilimelia sp.]|nr:hypothetical protein [Pilimelia sp.]